jgi:hypothetical protein
LIPTCKVRKPSSWGSAGRCCSKIAEAEAAVSVNENKWVVMHMHVQLKVDELRGPPKPVVPPEFNHTLRGQCRHKHTRQSPKKAREHNRPGTKQAQAGRANTTMYTRHSHKQNGPRHTFTAYP